MVKLLAPMDFRQNFINPVGISSDQLFMIPLAKVSPMENCLLSQRRAIIKLIHKKEERDQLSNWRPISLLNTDYKILTAAFTKRLQTVLPNLINGDQTAYIKGRYIGQNIRLIQDVIDYADDEELEGAILFMDFSKAFDTLERNFLYATLHKFNFGNYFINTVKTMYNSSESCIINNGWLSSYFDLHRGIRQGCPLSALLFLLAVEIMATHVRQSSDISGFTINNNYVFFPDFSDIKISQVADDTTLFVTDEISIHNAIAVVNAFGSVSGLQLNVGKSEGLWLGRWKNRKDKPAGLKWNHEPIKSLGIYFGYDRLKCLLLNWEKKIERLKTVLNQWFNDEN